MTRLNSESAARVPSPSPPPAGDGLAARAEVARRWKLVAAFACVYVIWGSTYLAIRFAIETLPPFSMAGVRFLLAGGVLYAWARLARGAERPTRAQWRATAIVGVLLLVGGNGLVVWSEQRIPSGVAALLVAIVPCWMVLVDWLRPNGARPTKQVVVGLALGLCGILFLVGPDALIGGGRVDSLGAAALVLASFSWAAGSIYSRHAAMPSSPFLATAMEMLAGGAAALALGLVLGEPGRLDLAAVSARSVAGWLYLVVFGSVIAFTAYVWLLRESTPARVSTYAYVNPVVAVALGAALGGEALTPRMVVAAAVIVGGVALITLAAQGDGHVK
ncbi:MAG TPA: drug/metabolite exporter YedA [Gammaproteobacteria bacterium]|nr:drug/metabolite exporter YedA [Gammaproteobacteria bacterium]